MRLYSGMSANFVLDTVRNQIADKLKSAFFAYYRYNPSPGEVNSWRNSLRAIAQVFEFAGLNDHGILLEYQLPLSSRRLDCLICGRDQAHVENAVIVELKQWERCEPSEAEKLVRSWVGGRKRELIHPAVQVGQYRQYLEDCHTAFHEGENPIKLSACSYLHNYQSAVDDPIIEAKFLGALAANPLFDADGTDKLAEFLRGRLASGAGATVLNRIENSKFRPSLKLMEHVADTIKSRSPWVLLDEQLVVYEQIRATIRSSLFGRRKQVVIVRGGPGTGKSVLAINLLADLLRDNKNAHYATGSKAFTETLWKQIGSRSKANFKYFNNYGGAAYNEIDVLICDESHRIRVNSNNRFMKKEQRSTKAQVQEIMEAAKVSVFFIDDRQIVRPNEIGSTAHIKEHATALDAEVFEYELEVQFRCAGSDGFINWIDNTLGVQRTANVIWDGNDGFDFRIYSTPEELEVAIREAADAGFAARVAAGFCWPWSEPRIDGTLVDDVVVGDYKRPWDAKPGNWKLAPGIPSAALWATDPNGINQIGCVYNIQGFELDYMGVIWGRDLVYRFKENSWIGNKQESADSVVKRSGEKFVELVKNTYRVLLSRGMKGCFVHFMDPETEQFFRSRIEGINSVADSLSAQQTIPATKVTSVSEEESADVLPFRRIPSDQARPYVNCVPLVDLEIAAGSFGHAQSLDAGGSEWIELPEGLSPAPGLFVSRVVGESMNKRIPNGSWCLFRSKPVGTRQGKIVIAEHRSISDAETGGSYTVKQYRSEKAPAEDGEWQHAKVVLSPMSSDGSYLPIVLSDADAAEVNIVAELVAVLQ